MVAFQQGGTPINDIFDWNEAPKERSLLLPKAVGRTNPLQNFKENTDRASLSLRSWQRCHFRFGDKKSCVVESEALGLSFIFSCQKYIDKMNSRRISSHDSQSCSQLETLITILQRCLSIADHLHHEHIALTVNEALYCKLLELKWSDDQNWRPSTRQSFNIWVEVT